MFSKNLWIWCLHLLPLELVLLCLSVSWLLDLLVVLAFFFSTFFSVEGSFFQDMQDTNPSVNSSILIATSREGIVPFRIQLWQFGYDKPISLENL